MRPLTRPRPLVPVVAFVLGLVASWPRPAKAEGPIEVELATRVGAATTPAGSPGWPANVYGFGFGGRAGVSIYGFFGGLSAIYYLGGSPGVDGYHSLLIGLEAGYTFKLRVMRLRPQVGFGDGNFTESAPDGTNPANPPVATTVGNIYVEPGLVAIVPIGPIFVGVDANALILPSFTLAAPEGSPANPARTYVSFSAHGQVGVMF
jgi:hypothetical protein